MSTAHATIFKEEIDNTVRKLLKYRSPDRFIFNIVTDTHLFPDDRQSMARFEHSIENLCAVSAAVRPNCIFHLGDMLWWNPQVDNPTYWNEERTAGTLNYARSEFLSCNKNTFFVPGNHDGAGASEPNPSVWSRQMVDLHKSSVTHHSGVGYYFVDFKEYKLRAVILMSCFKTPDGVHYGYFKDQLLWLCREALQVPKGYQILLFAHMTPVGPTVGRFHNADLFCELMTAFSTRTVFRSADFSHDFKNAEGSVSAMFVGHGHVDWSEKFSCLPCRVIETACNLLHVPQFGKWPIPENGEPRPRAYGTVTEDLWDTAVLNMKTGQLDIVRFGSGADRHFNIFN